MSAAQTALPLAADGKPQVDVIELATAILLQGERKETMVSQREIRAMASAINDFNQALSIAEQLVFLVDALGARPESPGLHRTAWDVLADLKKKLEALGYNGLEKRIGSAS